MNYLKTAQEVINYCPRVSVPADKELIYSNIASRMTDEYLGRSLSIQYYLVDFELTEALVGRIPKRPILAFAPTALTTGVQIRPMRQVISGGRAELAGWSDFILPTDATNSAVNLKTGRFEIFMNGVSDFGRMTNDYNRLWGGAVSPNSWQAQAEIYAGHLLDTTLSMSAPHSTDEITLSSVIGVIANSTRINFGASSTAYTITSVDVDTNECTITPMLSGSLPIGTEVTQVVPEDVRIANGMIISDMLTYEPNTLRQTETLDVITDRFTRMGTHFIPLDAQRMLSKYRN